MTELRKLPKRVVENIALDAMAERDALRAKVERVKALHRKVCPCWEDDDE